MLKATILDYQSLAPTDLNMQALWQLPISWTLHDYTSASETASRIAEQDIILTNKVVLDENLLRSNPQIKLIIILATGTNNVDLLIAQELNIPVCNIVAYSTESVVQHTFAFILAMQTHLLEYQHSVKNGDWCKSQFFGLMQFPIQEVAGKTLGIIGFGAIGKRIKTVAEALGMNVIVAKSLVNSTEQEIDRVSLNELYQQSDIISIHCPLSPYSQNLINAEAFALMKPTALLLNMGRGGIVNEQALANALINKQIRAAATDVLSQEPPSPNHVLLNSTIPNLMITPHTAWASREARQELLDQVVKILHSLQEGILINQVNVTQQSNPTK